MRMNRFVIVVAFFALIAGCTAEQKIKQGAEGEICNDRDLDCREGHVCNLGVCVRVDGGAYSCADVCEKLISCQAASGTEACIAQCRNQFEGACSEELPCPWSDTAIDIYSACIVEDLTCDDLSDPIAARDTCFATLPYPEDRATVCESFVQAAAQCSSDANTPELELRCARLARTTTEESWSRTEACETRVADGFCNEIEDCLNSVFEINLDLTEGDDEVDPVPPG